MKIPAFSNIKFLLEEITGEKLNKEEEYTYGQNIPTDAHNPSSQQSSLSSIGKIRESNPSISKYWSKDAKILSLFRKPIKNQPPKVWRNSSPKHPKKEYFRCKLIRGHKSLNRKIQNPNKTPKNFWPSDAHSVEIRNKLIDIYNENTRVLSNLSKRENEPRADGEFKSFNDGFCKKYFKTKAARKSFFYYCELLFGSCDPNFLFEEFKIWCCFEVNSHSHLCCRKWKLLKILANDIMISDLGIEPWFPNGYPREENIDEKLNKIMEENTLFGEILPKKHHIDESLIDVNQYIQNSP